MSDELREGDPLKPVVELLQSPIEPAPGLERRTRQRARQLRGRRVRQLTIVALLFGVIELTAHRPVSGTPVTFSIAAPASTSVSLVGDFTDWRPDRIRLERGSAGTWHATVTLAPGRYRFAYVVDQNQWRADSSAAIAPDDFGRPTSALTVGGH